MVNVWGDSIGTGIIAHLCEKEQLNTKNFKFQEFNSKKFGVENNFENMNNFGFNEAFSTDDNTYETAL